MWPFGRSYSYVNFEDLVGETLTKIVNENNAELYFHTESGKVFKMYHQQDCCESVSLEDVIGDLDDLIGSPITMAEESVSGDESSWGSATWTFYKLATLNGYVTLRWYGESNGYYSESVDFVLESAPEEPEAEYNEDEELVF
jgi:hypothetical protein